MFRNWAKLYIMKTLRKWQSGWTWSVEISTLSHRMLITAETIFFYCFYLFIWKRERENLSSTGLLSKCQQWWRLDRTKPRSQTLTPGLQYGWLSHHLLVSRAVRTEQWIWEETVPYTQTLQYAGIPINVLTIIQKIIPSMFQRICLEYASFQNAPSVCIFLILLRFL